MIKIETERLLIRDHIEEDLYPMHEMLSNKKVMFYIRDLLSHNIEDSKNNLNVAITEANSSNRKKYFFAITDKETKEYIGEIGFQVTIESDMGNIVELGYFIKEKFWGKGIVTEAAKPVIEFTFTKLNTLKIETGCNADNKGSENIMKKLGMIKEAEFKSHVLLDNKFYDRVEYRMMRDEWMETLR